MGQGIAVAAGAGLWGGGPASAQDETLSTCASSHAIDGSITPFGAVRVVLGGSGGKTVAVPVRITAPDGVAELDVSGRMPTIRLGRTPSAVVLTLKSIRLKRGAPEEPWRESAVRRLLAAIKDDRELQRAVISLRAALHAAYPQYLALSRHGAPAKIGEHYAKANRTIEKFGKSGGAQDCHTTTFVETVTSEVTSEVDVILTAVEQADRCLKDCEDRYGKPFEPGSKPIEYGFCAAGCAVDGFVALVVGTMEIVETITEEVVRQVVQCVLSPPPGFFPNPFDTGVFAGFAGAGGRAGDTNIDARDVKQAVGILKDLLSLGKLVDCLLAGEWSLTKLRNLHVNVDGVEEIPFGVTVCVDKTCAESLFSGGGQAFSLLIAIITKGDIATVTAAVTAAGVAAAEVAAVVAACMLIIGLLAILLAHLLIVAGQIALLGAAGMTGNGICITHPSLPVAAVAAINPIVGIVALGNTPLVVTPR